MEQTAANFEFSAQLQTTRAAKLRQKYWKKSLRKIKKCSIAQKRKIIQDRILFLLLTLELAGGLGEYHLELICYILSHLILGVKMKLRLKTEKYAVD